jgi:hypothetical protein
MQNRIEEHPDFEGTIRDDPIELLKKIKVLMHDPIRVITLMNIKQFEQERLLDYIKRFKQFRESRNPTLGLTYSISLSRTLASTEKKPVLRTRK